MKQTLLMIALTLVGTVGAFFEPFYGVAVYYAFAVMRPQYIWAWALPELRWSLYVAIATLIASLLHSGRDSGTERARAGIFGAAHVMMLLFAVWLLVTYITAQNRDVAYPWLLEYLKIFLMFFVSSVLVRTLRQIWVLFAVVALAIGYVAYEVNFMYITSKYMGIYHNGYGGLDNNGAGLMFAMVVPVCLFVYMGTTKWWRWVFASLIPVLLHAVLMTFSRGAMVSLIGASPVLFSRGRNRGQLFLAAAAMAAVIPPMAGAEIRARFFTLENYEDEGSARLRFASWEAAYQIALDYPLFGVGVRNSPEISAQYGTDMEGRVIHSQLLQILADTGFPGLIIYLVLLTLTMRSLRRVRHWARPRDDADARMAYAVACGVEGSIAVFVIGSLFLSVEVFELPYVLLLLGAQLERVLKAQGIMLAPPVEEAPKPHTFRPPRRVAMGGTP